MPHTPVAGAGLHEDAPAGAEQVTGQVCVLAELGHVAAYDEVEAALLPPRLVEAPHGAAELLGLPGMPGAEDPGRDLLVAEQPRLVRHHVVLGRGERVPALAEPDRPPLAQAALADAAVTGRLVPPEVQIFQALAAPLGGDQLLDGHRKVIGHDRQYARPPA
ncbi:hypothetical protein GCM10020220_037190 [Nonomuraea rubra]